MGHDILRIVCFEHADTNVGSRHTFGALPFKVNHQFVLACGKRFQRKARLPEAEHVVLAGGNCLAEARCVVAEGGGHESRRCGTGFPIHERQFIERILAGGRAIGGDDSGAMKRGVASRINVLKVVAAHFSSSEDVVILEHVGVAAKFGALCRND